MIGQTLANRYTLTARLGKGAMGTVYRATDTQTGQEVAVKVIARDLALDLDAIERFRREGEALRQLRHPNIVGFVDAFQHGEQYVIVMEYVPGGSLHDLIKQGPLPVDRARQIALDLCDALIRAHRLNIVHRDIKPENVLIAEDGTPKLTDFGVARLVSEGARLTGTGTQIGTPFYMSPEAWEGKPLDAQADIWSLGIVLYEMLSGEVPFGGETLVAVMNKVLTAPLPDLKIKRPDAPAGLIDIVRRMLIRDKSKRYQLMREVSLDLERSALTPTPPTKPVKRIGHAPRRAWLIASIIGLFVLAVGGYWLGGAGNASSQPSPTVTQVAEISETGTSTLPPSTPTRKSTATQKLTTPTVLALSPSPATTAQAPQLIDTISIPSATNAGITYTVPQSGTYIFQYNDSTSAFWNGINWATAVLAFRGAVPQWANSYTLNYETALFAVGDYGYTSKQSAIDSTKGMRAIIRLNAGGLITLVAADGKTDYSDNTGEITLDIFLVTSTPSTKSVPSPTVTSATTPIVAYTWDFDSPGDSEGWGKTNSHDIAPIQVTRGLLVTRSTGYDPYFFRLEV